MADALTRGFFSRKTLAVARDLVGCVLARRAGGKTVRAIITETEAYVGPHDLASHASRGKTARTEVMFGAPGAFYVYLVYGMHWMLNVVTEREGYPAAVLLRGIEGVKGPARLTRLLKITGAMNGVAAAPKSGLWFEPRPSPISPKSIRTSPRVGVGYAGPVWAKKRYRFTLEEKKKSEGRRSPEVSAAQSRRGKTS